MSNPVPRQPRDVWPLRQEMENWDRHGTGRAFVASEVLARLDDCPPADPDGWLRGPVLALLAVLGMDWQRKDVHDAVADVRAALDAAETVRPHRPDDLAVLQRRIDTTLNETENQA